MLCLSLLQQLQFDVFDPKGDDGAFVAFFALLLPLGFLLGVFVYFMMAWHVYAAASRLAVQGHGPALFPPYLWGLASLVGVFVVPFAFALIHYATWFEPDEDVPWSRDGAHGRLGMMGEATELHIQRVAELREELAAARGSHRRRYIRSELHRLEKDGPPRGDADDSSAK